MFRWNVLCDGRVSEDQMIDRVATRRNTHDGRKIGKRGIIKRYRKLVDTGGAGGLE